MDADSILVTGGAGYIGSHVVLSLLERGRSVVVVDNLSTGRRDSVPAAATLIHADCGDVERMAEVIRTKGVTSVMHFAGSTVVPESVFDPLAYYRNNTGVSRNLLKSCLIAGVDKFIFSSTAAVYGNPQRLPVSEDEPVQPITPYGTSKLMTEWILRDVEVAHGLRFVALRYFNVAGADPLGRTGQMTPNATHLIKVVCEAAAGLRAGVTVYGDDYDTADGTCVRDFIHVTDLAEAHVAALDHLERGGDSQILNCGYGRGISVRQVIEAIQRLSGRELAVTIGPRRPGDIKSMIASTERIRRLLDWTPQYDDIDTIVRSAYEWELAQAGHRKPWPSVAWPRVRQLQRPAIAAKSSSWPNVVASQPNPSA